MVQQDIHPLCFDEGGAEYLDVAQRPFCEFARRALDRTQAAWGSDPRRSYLDDVALASALVPIREQDFTYPVRCRPDPPPSVERLPAVVVPGWITERWG